MIDNLPNGWKVEELGNCVDILDNQRIPLNNQDREERIKGKNISELFPYYGATQQVGYIDDFLFDEELVLLGEDGVMFYDKDKQKAYLINGKSWVNNHAHVLRAKKNITINKYLVNFLNTFHYKGFVSGATRLKLNQSRMAKIPIPIPPLEQQKKIVKVLDLTSNLIEKQKELLKKYDLFLKSKFIEMFGDPILNPMGWEVKKLKDLSTLIMSGNTPKGGSEVYVDKGILFFRSQNVWKNKILLDEIAYIDNETHSKMKKSSLKHKDILMTKTGRFNTENSSLGRASLFLGKDDSANINGHVYLIRLKKNMIHRFVVYILTTNEYRDYIRKICVGGIDKRQINKTHLEDFPIIFPPLELQNKFSSIVEKIEIIKEKENQKLKQMNDLHNSMMNKAFKGDIK
ncbi:restriction endonuclease subunit S [Aliarcobacter butzleri]|uniref:restriction endonuclease subunit S n=2 Tax=Aliarcobacter butzleri TaxID=28197 RepID=UPI0021B36B54|nr:restriction endonuclease subunit S [Aliarcobacter butzleri]MCT7596852.1 restriction endonuclease subunit S [Aliarcobacter butzleri]